MLISLVRATFASVTHKGCSGLQWHGLQNTGLRHLVRNADICQWCKRYRRSTDKFINTVGPNQPDIHYTLLPKDRVNPEE